MTTTTARRPPAKNPTPSAPAQLSAVDLFCGAGGLSEGLRQAGFRITAGADHDIDAVATYAANFPGTVALRGDIRSPRIRGQLQDAAAGADVIVGGPPCQAFSQVRNHSRLIDDPRNSLYREFVEAVGEARPAAFLMENVPGMAQMGVKEQVLADLAIEGEYRVVAQLVDAADFGVPQTRKRLLFLGIRADLRTSPPELAGTGATAGLQLARVPGTDSTAAVYTVAANPERNGPDLALRLANPLDDTAVSAAQAISDLGWLEAGQRIDSASAADLPDPDSAYQVRMRAGLSDTVLNLAVPRSRPDTLLRLAGIPAGGNHRDLPEHLQARYITGEKWGPHNGSGRLGRSHFYAYRRLHPDIWAWTLNTKGDSVYHYHSTRSLSVREFARLQSFPDRFIFLTDPQKGHVPGRVTGGANHSKYRQVGNAVPPLLAAAAASAIRDAILASRPAVSHTA